MLFGYLVYISHWLFVEYTILKLYIPRVIISVSVGDTPQEVAPMKLFESRFQAFLFEIKLTLEIKKIPQKKKRSAPQNPGAQSISQTTIIVNRK